MTAVPYQMVLQLYSERLPDVQAGYALFQPAQAHQASTSAMRLNGGSMYLGQDGPLGGIEGKLGYDMRTLPFLQQPKLKMDDKKMGKDHPLLKLLMPAISPNGY